MKIDDVVIAEAYGAPGSRALGTGNFRDFMYFYQGRRLREKLLLDFGYDFVVELTDAQVDQLAKYYNDLPDIDAKREFVYGVMARADKFEAVAAKLGFPQSIYIDPRQIGLFEKAEQPQGEIKRGQVRGSELNVLLKQAYARYPQAQSDIEALVMYDLDQQKNTTQNLNQQEKTNQRQDDTMRRLSDLTRQQSQKITALDQENDELSAELDKIEAELPGMIQQVAPEPTEKEKDRETAKQRRADAADQRKTEKEKPTDDREKQRDKDAERAEREAEKEADKLEREREREAERAAKAAEKRREKDERERERAQDRAEREQQFRQDWERRQAEREQERAERQSRRAADAQRKAAKVRQKAAKLPAPTAQPQLFAEPSAPQAQQADLFKSRVTPMPSARNSDSNGVPSTLTKPDTDNVVPIRKSYYYNLPDQEPVDVPAKTATSEAKKDSEKIGGQYDPEQFDAMVARLKKLAGAGEMKTVWDPVRRVYKNVPVAPQTKSDGDKK